MIKKALIEANCLKDLLSLFDKEQILNNLTFGDTCHTSSSYVDESILNGKNKVKDILKFKYDFKGLVAFEANINKSYIHLVNEVFEITGPEVEIKIIHDKAIELNAYNPGKLKFNYIKTYE